MTLCACYPPGYTKEYSKELATQNYPKAVEWFAHNIPDAKVGSKCTSYTNAISLFSAICGSYSLGHNKYEYIYDYENDEMYLSQGFDEACQLVKDKSCRILDLETKNVEIRPDGIRFETLCCNDNITYAQVPAGEVISSGLIKMVPASLSLEEFSDKIVSGQLEMKYFLYSYVNAIPEYDQVLYSNLSNLICIYYRHPVELESNDYIQACYSGNTGKLQKYNVAKQANGLYAGYIGYLSDDNESFTYTDLGNGSFSLDIPANCSPIILSENKVKIVLRYTTGNNEIKEEELEHLNSSPINGWDNCKLYNTVYPLKGKTINAYEIRSDYSERTHYEFIIK